MIRLHNWRPIARDVRDVASEWECSHCKARAYGPNVPSIEGCTGYAPRSIHDRPEGNVTHTRDDF